VLLNIRNKPAFTKNIKHNLGHLAETKLDLLGQVVDFSLLQVYLQLVTVTNHVSITDEDGKPNVNGITEEDTRYRLGQNGTYP